MKHLKSIRLLAILGLAALLGGCGPEKAQEDQPSENAAQKESEGNPLTAPVDYLGAVNKGGKFANKTLELSQVTKALQEFKILEGRFPKDLAELVDAGMLAKEPEAPYGMEVTYDAQTGQVDIRPAAKKQ